MLARKQLIIVTALGLSTILATVAEAQLKLPFKRRTSAPAERSVALTQSNGPWLVMCASFTGENGVQQANHLVSELQAEGLNAYTYRHTFNHRQQIQPIPVLSVPEDEASYPELKTWRPASADMYSEVAVVVGDFAAVDDRAAQATLEKVRSLYPRSLVSSDYVATNQVAEQRQRALGRGPMAAAFLMPNPMLPEDYFNARNLDKVVVKMNRGIRNSLLDCPGNYSVRVATFSGESLFNADNTQIERSRRDLAEKAQSGEKFDSPLMEAAYKANVLCRALRKKGVEAYEFHDRNESYVCVGSFDVATTKDHSGKDLLNPEIADIILKYKGRVQNTPNGPQMKAVTLAAFKDYDINFDVQPMPVTVPKAARRAGGIFRR